MQLSEKGAAFVRLHEGYVRNFYLDPVGVGTIGIGFTRASKAFRTWWAKHRPGVKFGPGAVMSRAEAEDALRFLFAEEYGKAVNAFLGKAVPQHVFDAVASAVYNLGPKALNWKWAKAVKAGDYAGAAKLLAKTGTTAKGKTLAGLVRRRKEEAKLIEHGIYTGVGNVVGITIPVADADGVLVRQERGPAVAQLIRDLHRLGYYYGLLDDVFGPGTEAAVIVFQRDKGLEPDGKAGPVTLAAIARALAEKAAAEPEVVVVEKPVVADPGELETPPAQSKTVWTWLFTAVGAPIAAFGNLDWRVQMLIVAVIVGFAIYGIKRRNDLFKAVKALKSEIAA